jgi:sialate O-acetylesterase
MVPERVHRGQPRRDSKLSQGPGEASPRLADPLAQRGAPFYICQLAALKGSGELPEKRAGQEMILKLPDTGMALTIDVGDPANVHPKNKQAVGDRLCRIALAEAYGQNIEFSGPVVESMKIEGGIVSLKFSHAEGGLVAKGSDAVEVKTFQVAGSDGKFVPATAKIDGNGILVSCSEVGAPKAVRYAWEPYPEACNLYNKAGLPAAPFKKSE